MDAKLKALPPPFWLSESVVNKAQEYFDGLISDIASAQHSIEFGVYIFELDAVGERLVEALSAAAGRGVKVRVLIDGVGSADDGDKIASLLAAAGVEARIYHPLPWSISAYRWSLHRGNTLSKLLSFILLINRRDHRKLCVIDRRLLWCGSFNITLDHMPQQSGGGDWHDYAARVEGPNCAELAEHFLELWFQRKPRIVNRHFRFYFANAGARLLQLRNRLLIHKIKNATNRLWICSAYFSPSGVVIKAIREAAKRGADVRILVAKKSDIRLFPILTATYFEALLPYGVKVYAYEASILHAKVAIIDNECIIGSTNFNHRSFYHDLETDLILHHRDSLEQMTTMLAADMAKSQHIDRDDLKKQRWWVLLGWLPRLMRYWM